MVVLLTAIVTMPYLVKAAMQKHYSALYYIGIKRIFLYSKYVLCVVITTLAREIIKDVEDYKGDKATEATQCQFFWGI